MALILNIETATTNCSVSLSKDGETLLLKEDYGANFSHAERLHVYIDEVLEQAKVSKQDLDAVAVSKGPGSYTGLRIGVSAAKGLCFALDIPLIAVDTLKALACQVITDKGVIIPMLDARRMEVYSAILDSNYEFKRKVEAEVLTEESFKQELDSGLVTFIGDGVAKTKELITHDNAQFIDGKLPSANEMGKLSEALFNSNSFEDVAYFEPYYLKDFVVVKSKKKQ